MVDWGCLIGCEMGVVITLTGKIDRADVQSQDLKVVTVKTRQIEKEKPPTTLRDVKMMNKVKLKLFTVNSVLHHRTTFLCVCLFLTLWSLTDQQEDQYTITNIKSNKAQSLLWFIGWEVHYNVAFINWKQTRLIDCWYSRININRIQSIE